MPRLAWVLSVLFSSLVLSCSTGLLVQDDCPCAQGWTCCAGDNVCVREGARCPSWPSADAGVDATVPAQDPADATPEDAAQSSDADADTDRMDADALDVDASDQLDAGRPDAAGQQEAGALDATPTHGQTCLGGRWCWWLPSTPGDSYTGLWGRSAQDVWLVTNTGSIVRSDGGEVRHVYQSPALTLGAVVWGNSTDTWFALSDASSGRVLRWDGLGFRRMDSGSPPLRAIYAGASTAEATWVVGAGASAARWTRNPSSGSYAGPETFQTGVAAERALVDVWPIDERLIWIMDEHGTSYLGDLTAGTWTPHADTLSVERDSGGIGLWGTGPNDVWAIHDSLLRPSGGLVTVFRHFDGQTWTRSELTCAQRSGFVRRGTRHVWKHAANDVWVTTETLACTYHWDGSSWTRVDLGGEERGGEHALWSAGANLWLAGASGFISVRGPDGAWQQVADRAGYRVASVAAVHDENVYAVVQGALRRFDGSRWDTIATPQVSGARSVTLTKLYAYGSGEVWVFGKLEMESAASPFNAFVGRLRGTRWTGAWRVNTAHDMVGTPQHGIWIYTDLGARRMNDGVLSTDDLQVPIRAVAGSDTSLWQLIEDTSKRLLLRRKRQGEFEEIALPEPDLAPLWMYAVQDELWLRGRTSANDPVVYHWKDSRWRAVDTLLTQAWGTRANDVWFSADSAEARAAAYHWDGFQLTRDASGIPGEGVLSISATERYVYLGLNGIVRGAR